MLWSVEGIKDLTGKVVIVTGGNSGLGFENCKVLASKNATVILATRSLERGNVARDKIVSEFKYANVVVSQLDLSSQESIKKFATCFNENYDRLDILINNAGIMTTPYGLTEDGFEQQLGVNHFGHFALTALVFNKLKSTKGARIINVSSSGHRQGIMNFDDLNYSEGKKYSPMTAYARSKLANLLFTYELKNRIDAAGLDIKVLASHPGGANTNLPQHIEGRVWFKLARPLLEVLVQSAYAGSLPTLRAAVDSGAKSGEYYGPDGFMEMSGKPIIVDSNKRSKNIEDMKRLFDLSEEVLNVKYEF